METKKINFGEAINEALLSYMKKDKRVFILGCGVTSPTAIFGSTKGLYKKFGRERVIEIPIAENGITGIAFGASLLGMRPVIIHQRIDFILLSMDQIINHAAKWCYMFGGKMNAPLTIRCIIGRGWGQGSQHSQSFQALFAHIPGLKVVMPSDPYNAKGLLISSIEDKNPVIFIEHRWLYKQKSDVPSGMYKIPLGKGNVVRKGKDLTIVASSLMVSEAKKAAQILAKDYKIDVEIIDLLSLRPLDEKLILNSVSKTHRLLILDVGHKAYGISAEFSALVPEFGYKNLKSPIKRLGLPEAPTPTSVALEDLYYPGVEHIIQTAQELMSGKKSRQLSKVVKQRRILNKQFIGPF